MCRCSDCHRLPAGLIAGYYAGKFEAVSNWVVSILMSLPGLIVLLTIRAAFGPSVWISMIAFGILISPSYFRLTRTAVQSVRNELYVDAARVSGLSDLSIIARHIFSVVRAPIIIQTAAIAGVAIAIQSGLEFLGLGDPTKATWGVMLSEGFKNVYLTPDSASVACTGHGSHHRRTGSPRQRHPRRLGRRRKDQAPQESRCCGKHDGGPPAKRASHGSQWPPSMPEPNTTWSR